MGNTLNPQDHELVRNYKKDQWYHLSKSQTFQLWKHKYTHQTVQVHRIYQIPKQKDIQSYQFRNKTNDIIKVFHLTIDNLSFICQNQDYGQILIQHIPKRLSQIIQMTEEEAITSMIAAIRGFWVLQKKYGEIEPNQEMIGFNEQGQTKIWLNKQFHINQKQKTNYINKNNYSKPPITKIFQFYSAKTRNFLSQNLRRQFNNGNLSYENAILMLSNYAKIEKKSIKKYIQIGQYYYKQQNRQKQIQKIPININYLKQSHVSPYLSKRNIFQNNQFYSPAIKRINSQHSLQRQARIPSFSLATNNSNLIFFQSSNNIKKHVPKIKFTFYDSQVSDKQKIYTERINRNSLPVQRSMQFQSFVEQNLIKKDQSIEEAQQLIKNAKQQVFVEKQSKIVDYQDKNTQTQPQVNKEEQIKVKYIQNKQNIQETLVIGRTSQSIKQPQNQQLKISQHLQNHIQQENKSKQQQHQQINKTVVKQHKQIFDDNIKQSQQSYDDLRNSPYFINNQNNIVGSIQRFVSFGPSKIQKLQLNTSRLKNQIQQSNFYKQKSSDSFRMMNNFHQISDDIQLSSQNAILRSYENLFAIEKTKQKQINENSYLKKQQSIIFDGRNKQISNSQNENRQKQFNILENNNQYHRKIKIKQAQSFQCLQYQKQSTSREYKQKKRLSKSKHKQPQKEDFLDINYLEKSLQKIYSPNNKISQQKKIQNQDDDLLNIARLQANLQKFSKSQQSIDQSKRLQTQNQKQQVKISLFIQPRFTFQKNEQFKSKYTQNITKTQPNDELHMIFQKNDYVITNYKQQQQKSSYNRKRYKSQLIYEDTIQNLKYQNKQYKSRAYSRQSKHTSDKHKLQQRYSKYVRPKQQERSILQKFKNKDQTTNYYKNYRSSYNYIPNRQQHQNLLQKSSKLKKSNISYKELRSILWN